MADHLWISIINVLSALKQFHNWWSCIVNSNQPKHSHPKQSSLVVPSSNSSNIKTIATIMSISDFRKKKLLFLFNVFFDVNQSGEIDIKDFELAIERVCQLRGWAKDTPKNKETHATMLEIWEGLRSKADKDNDGQVSVEEWCNMWDNYAKDPSTVLDWQNKYMNFMFDLEDASNDGGIDVKEFALVCSSYGLDKKECEEAFEKMSQGKSEVTREEFAVLWKEYFAAENTSAPGNFIFGKTSF